MDYTTISDTELAALIKTQSEIARTAYKEKKQHEAEAIRRALAERPADISEADFEPGEAPGGLTSKQISEIRKWAKTPHSTDSLIAFITKLIQGETHE